MSVTPENVRSIVAANIRREMARQPHLSSQYAMARATGLPQRTIGRVVNEEQTGGLEILTRIATALGLAVNVLLLPAATSKKS